MKQFLIALDQTLNTLIRIDGDGFGFADETLSLLELGACAIKVMLGES